MYSAQHEKEQQEKIFGIVSIEQSQFYLNVNIDAQRRWQDILYKINRCHTIVDSHLWLPVRSVQQQL